MPSDWQIAKETSNGVRYWKISAFSVRQAVEDRAQSSDGKWREIIRKQTDHVTVTWQNWTETAAKFQFRIFQPDKHEL
jgi:hypothetical protein